MQLGKIIQHKAYFITKCGLPLVIHYAYPFCTTVRSKHRKLNHRKSGTGVYIGHGCMLKHFLLTKVSHQKNLQPRDPEGRNSGLSLKGGLHALRAKRKSRVAPRKEGGVSDCTARVHLSSLKGGTCVVRVATVAEAAPPAAAFQGHKRPTIRQALADTGGSLH